MESNAKLNLPLIGIGVASLVLALGVYYYFIQLPAPEPVMESADTSVGAQVSSAAQTPADKLPETNPFEAKTNPFTEYTNPFE